MQGNQEEGDTMYAVTTVTDNDDDPPDSTTSATNTAEQDRLRIAAEKRRQKILNQANTRMSIVEGTYSSTTGSTTGIGSSSKPATTGNTEGAGVTKADEDVLVTDDGTETPVVESSTDTSATEAVTTTTTTSSKLAAMRRRRFQKKAAPAATDARLEEEEDAITNTTTTITPTTSASKPEETVTVAVVVTEPMVDTPVVNSSDSATEPGTDIPSDTTTTTATNKKYLGVAKMRRRMIKERHEQQQQQHDDSTLDDPGPAVVAATSISSTKTKKQRTMITTLPILTYVITTLLLFWTGLHVGLQQSNVNYCYASSRPVMVNGDDQSTADGYCYNTKSDEPQWSLLVHSELAPRQMGGLQRLLSTVVGPVVPSSNSMIPNAEWHVDAAVASPPDRDDTEDEFSPANVQKSLSSSSNNNIDPLFQVDLDALTAGDGLYFTLGRFAVRVHRFILSIVLDLPRSILQSILSFVWSFVQTPPVLFLMAVLIRHGLGKAVLGAKLPTNVVDDAAHKDILSTVKTFVTKFVLSSFPTITIVYDVWTHVRSDMYVMLCGLFVGLAVSHSHQAGSPYGDTTSRFDGSSSTTMNGISDEL